MAYSEYFVEWLEIQSQIDHFKTFMEIISEQRQHYINGALQRGDREFEKGAVEAFDWVLGLPDWILKEAKRPDDTTETSGKET